MILLLFRYNDVGIDPTIFSLVSFRLSGTSCGVFLYNNCFPTVIEDLL